MQSLSFQRAILHSGERLSAAQDAYRCAVRMLAITDGPEQPYSKVAVSKLVSKLKIVSPGSGVQDCCAVCGVLATMQCGKCHQVVYCCEEHQHAHWRVHKKGCVKQKQRKAQYGGKPKA